MATKKEGYTMLTARIPATLAKALDRAAARGQRSRSGELIFRLQQSLRADRQRGQT